MRVPNIARVALCAIFLTFGLQGAYAQSDKLIAWDDYTEGRHDQAVPVIMKYAAHGDPWAVHMMGLAYVGGFGVEKSAETAVDFFRKAAELGYTFGEYELGRALEEGHGVERNLNEAVKWLVLAADKGHTDAQIVLARCIDNGVKPDDRSASYWRQLAALNTFPSADTFAGDELRYGLHGETVDLTKALEQYRLGAEWGDAKAHLAIARAYALGEAVAEDRAMEVQWLKSAVALGLPEAMHNLASNYRGGVGVDQDYDAAFKLLQQAAMLGFGRSQNDLAGMYMLGYGTQQDDAMALAWFAVAIKGGYEASEERALNLGKTMSQDDLRRASAMEDELTAVVAANVAQYDQPVLLPVGP